MRKSLIVVDPFFTVGKSRLFERASVLVFNLFASIARARKKLAVQRACVRACERARFCVSRTRIAFFVFFEFSKAEQQKSGEP